MTELFQNVLEASFYGGIVIAVVGLARLALKKAPKKYICLLWLLAALRLLMPFEIESGFSLQPALDAVTIPGSEYAQQITTGFDSGVGEIVLPSAGEAVSVEKPEQDVTVDLGENTHVYEREVPLKVTILENYDLIAAWLWLAVAAGMVGYSVLSYLRLRRRVRDAVVLSEGVWVSGRVESPFVMGFFRPRIYLNPGLGEMEREYVLAHEDCHIRRLDHWWKWLGYITLAIHWFNPLVWLGYVLLCRDLEMACDEAVVKGMEVGERKAYSAALLACSARGRTIAACPVAFGEVPVKGRIQNVLNYRKPKFWLILAAVVAVVVIAVCFLTSPVQHSLLRLSDTSPREITGILLQSKTGFASISSEKELAEAVEVLKEVRYDPYTVVCLGPTDESDPQYSIVICCGDEQIVLYFTPNYSVVYDAGYIEVRQIENPEALKTLFEKSFNGVTRREVDSEPFAAIDDVIAWTGGIHLNAVEEAECWLKWTGSDSLTSSANGALRESRFLELLGALNALPQNAFTPQKAPESPPAGNWNAAQLQTSGTNLRISVTITDGANDLIAVLRYSVAAWGEEMVELVITDDRAGFESGSEYLDNLRCWSVADDTLFDLMGDFAAYPPIVQDISITDQPHWGITAYGKNASSTGIQFCFAQTDNSISGDLFYGQGYTLERWDGTKWTEVRPIIDNGTFTMEGIWLPKDTTTVVDIDWEWLYGSLPDGTYCISKEVWRDSESYTFQVCFAIEEGAAQTGGNEDLTEQTASAISDRTFTYEKDGFGGSFTIRIFGNGAFSYYEGLLSSYIGTGTWSVEGNILTLTDTGMGSDTRYFRFDVNNGHLYFRAEDSDAFLHADVADGDRFVGSGSAAEGEEVLRDQAFYEELFTRRTDGAYTTMWIADLYEAFYAEPEEFARQIARKFGEDPGTVRQMLTCMSYEVEWYEPERYLQTLEMLRNVAELDQTAVNLLCWYYWEGEYRALGGGSGVTVTDSGQDYLTAALEGCEILEGYHLQVSSGSMFRYTYVACRVEAAEDQTALYRTLGKIDENTYGFYLYVTFVPENDAAYAYSMAGNTGEYEGTDPAVPEGALAYSRCGYVTWREDGWHIEIVGTGW